ncbi:MAG: VWA domain-containing protein, partial [Cellvibrionaceae bacterium]|nr:VWA domain-containing protein [Cellvibrionaceae bacterium]
MIAAETLADFHWQRPLALALIPLAWLLCLLAWQLLGRRQQWRHYIDPSLLPHLLQGKGPSGNSSGWWLLLALALSLASLGLAGPSWEKIPVPVSKQDDALVIVLDLSPSMNANDIKPSRIDRARFKLIDLLKQRSEGQTGLVAYAGEAHVVSPLTDDTDTLVNLLPAMSPGLMPLSGSNVEMAIELALQLIRDSGRNYGNILLLSDGVVDEAFAVIENLLDDSQVRLSVMSVGSEAGGPIPIGPGGQGFVKDNSGGIIVAKTNRTALANLAAENGGVFATLGNSDRDIRSLQSFWQRRLQMSNDNTQEVEREFDQWIDRGYWLVLALVLLFPLSFRRGWLLSASPLLLGSLLAGQLYAPPTQAQAGAAQTVEPSLWQDLWQTRDQQAMEAFEEQNFDQASELFNNPEWRASADYERGDYQSAIDGFSGKDSAS